MSVSLADIEAALECVSVSATPQIKKDALLALAEVEIVLGAIKPLAKGRYLEKITALLGEDPG